MKIRGKEIEIDQRKFYQIGIAAFLIMAVMNTATLLQTYQALLLTQIVSQIGGILFNYALLGLFIHMLRGLPPKDLDLATDEELEGILETIGKKNRQ